MIKKETIYITTNGEHYSTPRGAMVAEQQNALYEYFKDRVNPHQIRAKIYFIVCHYDEIKKIMEGISI